MVSFRLRVNLELVLEIGLDTNLKWSHVNIKFKVHVVRVRDRYWCNTGIGV